MAVFHRNELMLAAGHSRNVLAIKPGDLLGSASSSKQSIRIRPSQFVETMVQIKNPHTGLPGPFSFRERRYLRDIYDSPYKRRLLKCGRQVEKSTLLGNLAYAYTGMTPGRVVLYVATSQAQAKTFSVDRIAEALAVSNKLAAWLGTGEQDGSVFFKKFENRSAIILKYAFLNADRIRGISADALFIDEVQDMLADNIPVIEQTTSHSAVRHFIYAGTPKSMDNPIEHYWQYYSNQTEWAVPCDSCNTWNDHLDTRNIGIKGLICQKCGSRIHAMHPRARWVRTNPNPRINGKAVSEVYDAYRISQLMVPWTSWATLLSYQQKYSPALFHNEVLGLSYNSGSKPFSEEDLRQNCDEKQEATPEWLNEYVENNRTRPIFLGVDWGGGSESSHTVISAGTYDSNGRFRYIFVIRLVGADSDPQEQVRIVARLMEKWNVPVTAVDFGGGHFPNNILERAFSRSQKRIVKFQYLGSLKKKMQWEGGLQRYLLNRTEVMSDFMSAIRGGRVVTFPRWEDFREPYATDCLSIFSEYDEQRQTEVFKKPPGVSDDTFHSLLLCFLASHVNGMPRWDVFLPSARIENPRYSESQFDLG